MSCRDEYVDRKYYKTSLNLVTVPDDIPDDALEVYLSDNRLYRIEVNTFLNLQQCTVLDLSVNNIGAYLLEKAFAGMECLRKLTLAHNNIQIIHQSHFPGLLELEKLDLDHNHIGDIEAGAFSDLQKLKVLNIAHSNLQGPDLIHGLFSELEALEDLFLEHNDIERLQSGVFVGLKELKTLELGFNSLSSLDADVFAGLESLQKLSLVGNSMTSITYTDFQPLPRPLELLLSNNPLQCGSDLCWLKYEEQEGSVTWSDGVRPNCGSDGSVAWADVNWNCSGRSLILYVFVFVCFCFIFSFKFYLPDTFMFYFGVTSTLIWD